MNDYSHATDRSPREIVLFAIGFLGFGMAASGVVIGSPAVAVLGAVILLLTVWSFRS